MNTVSIKDLVKHLNKTAEAYEDSDSGAAELMYEAAKRIETRDDTLRARMTICMDPYGITPLQASSFLALMIGTDQTYEMERIADLIDAMKP